MKQGTYVLVTPVRDEAKTIKLTIAAVVKQTVRPAEWVIVSDGSIDRTDELVLTHAARHPWITLKRRERSGARSFATVVHNTEFGVTQLSGHDYDFIGLLDGDVTFEPHYFERLMQYFVSDPSLGLAGGVVFDVGTPKRVPRNREEVPGAVQFYRRECFESLGGLIPVPEGGWDALSCAMARMKGYRTSLMVDLEVDHYKPRNVAFGSPLRRKFQMGQRDHALGYDPLFELVKCTGRMTERPMFGGLAWWLGYCSGMVQGRARVVPAPIIAFIRTEQRRRMKRLLTRSRVRTALSRPARLLPRE